MTAIHSAERANLLRLLTSLTTKSSDARVAVTADYLIAHYTAPERHYHTLSHVNECSNLLHWMLPPEDPETPERVRDRQAAELALWYHDLVFDPKLQNNEELSAAILRDHARELNLDATLVGVACTAIMATRHKAMPTTEVDKLVVDIDLNILRVPTPRFDHYERQIREEYAFVPDPIWIVGRSKVLQEFLDRDWIYSTPMYRRMYEGDARENIKRSLARLAKGEVLRLGLR